MRISKLAFAALLALIAVTVPTPGSYIITPSGGAIFPSSSTPSTGTSTPAGNTGTGVNVSVTLTPLPTVGSIVVVGFAAVSAQQSFKVTDNQSPSNAYSWLYLFQNDESLTNPRVAVFCSVVKVSSGTFTVTANSVTAGSGKFVVAKEYKNGTCNLDAVSPGAIGNTHPYSCGSLTTGNAKDILIAIVGQSFGGGGTNTATAPTGFTVIATQTNGNVVATGSMADQITSATGTFNGTYDLTNVLQPSVNNTVCGQLALMSH
jgi:hypothetical protein